MPDQVFINLRAAVYQGSLGTSTAFPDVCLCPPAPPAGPVPVPLPNMVKAADLTGGARTVLIGGKPTGKRSSYLATSTGNEVARSTGGGVVSHTVQGKAHFQSFSPNVFIEGEPAVRHLDLLTHNHLTQPGNTPPAVWMSAMDVPGISAGAGPKNLVKRLPRAEGKVTIQVVVADELGKPVATPFKMETPKGQNIEDRLLWGGGITLTHLDEGQCRLSLPEIDELCRRYKRKTPAEVGKGDVAYQPGRPRELATGKTHRVIVPAFRTLWVEIPLVADDGVLVTKQKFILSSDDGSYTLAKTVDPDQVLNEAEYAVGEERDGIVLTLMFPGLQKGLTYTLVHKGPNRPEAEVFSRQSFETLFARDADGSGDLGIREADARATSADGDE
jgi:hypothetical protein